jgi:hypothetical protein
MKKQQKQIYFGKILIKNTATDQKRTIEDVFREDQLNPENPIILNRIRSKVPKREAKHWIIVKFCIDTAQKVGFSVENI